VTNAHEIKIDPKRFLQEANRKVAEPEHPQPVLFKQ